VSASDHLEIKLIGTAIIFILFGTSTLHYVQLLPMFSDCLSGKSGLTGSYWFFPSVVSDENF